MNDLDMYTERSTAIAPGGGDPYAAYGAKVGTTGQYLSFKNGEYQYGQNKDELPIGTRLVANMSGLRVGWRRWYGGQVTDDLTELLNDRPQTAQRNTLGDNDESAWEKDDEDRPRDPWQLTNILELSDGEQTFIYSTASNGGIRAIGRLCTAYGKERRMRPGMLPIITLGKDFYIHKPKPGQQSRGKIYFPVFEIVGWTDEDNPSVEGGEDTGELPDGERRVQGQRAANPTQEGVVSQTSTMTKSPSNGAAGRRPTRF